LSELNFEDVNYIDSSDTRPSWKTLCSSLKNGNCVSKKYLRTGNHNITIQVLDKAGNSDEKKINFNI